MMHLELLWVGIISFCVFMYVLLDGFTLGISMLTWNMQADDTKTALSAVLPTWDGNQTWLVLGAASLYGAFPQGFAILLEKLFFPLTIMILLLLLRGVSFEFFLKSTRHKARWKLLLCLASLAVAICQGMILGNFVEGFDRHFINLFSVLCGLSLPFGYLLLGSTRLILKTLGALQEQMFQLSKYLVAIIALCMLLVSIATPLVDSYVLVFWFSWNNLIYLVWLPVITTIIFIGLYLQLKANNDIWPYWLTVALFVCPYVGFLISLYPYMVPFELTFWECAAPHTTLSFITVGAVVLLPTLLGYTFYTYYIFKGKIDKHISY